MAYSSLSDISLRITQTNLIELTDDDNSGTVGTAQLTRAVTDADNLIDAKLTGQFTVPFSSVPSIVNTISVVFSVHNLCAGRRGRTKPEWLADYSAAVSWLDDMADGTMGIPGYTLTAIPKGRANTSQWAPTFTQTHYTDDGDAIESSGGTMDVW